MSAPQLTIYADGVGTVSGDGLNTFTSSCDTAAELRSFVGIQGIQVFIRGTASPGDGGQGNFYWNINGTAADDNGVTTIVPSGAGSGEWTRLTKVQAAGVHLNGQPAAPSATASTTAIMAGLAQTFTPSSTGNILVVISGIAFNSLSGDGGDIGLRYGSGAVSPVYGASSAGTALCRLLTYTGAAVNQKIPFTVQGSVSGLAVGSPYWVDLAINADPAGSLTVNDLTVTVIES